MLRSRVARLMQADESVGEILPTGFVDALPLFPSSPLVAAVSCWVGSTGWIIVFGTVLASCVFSAVGNSIIVIIFQLFCF